MDQGKSEIRDNMQIDWDAPIRMDDGVVLRADVYRPVGGGKYPVILSYGPYAKGLSFQEGYPSQWGRVIKSAPNVLEGSSNKYQNWELVDPEKWVPDGYACVRVDSRGAGRSPGELDVWSAREAQDLYAMRRMGRHAKLEQRQGRHQRHFLLRDEPVERRRAQSAASRRAVHVGRLVRLLPRALPARRHPVRFPEQLASAPGGERAARRRRPWRQKQSDRRTGRRTRDVAERRAGEALRRHAGRGQAPAASATTTTPRAPPSIENIQAPLLSAANWGGVGLHTRGNFEGWLAAGSKQKWLEVHGDTHFTHFYSALRRSLAEALLRPFPQGRGHRLEQAAARFAQHPPSGREIRPARGERMAAQAHAMDEIFPAAGRPRPCNRTRPRPPPTLRYETTGDGLTFSTPPSDKSLEITGPVAAKLWVSSETTDADLFLVLRLFDPAGKEVTFIGSNDPRTPVGLGWLRASQRKLDPKKSLPYRPWHPHDEEWPLKPGEPVELDIEIWPTSIVVPPGYRLALTVRGKDYEVDGTDAALPNAPYPMKGVGPFLHIDPDDRPARIFACAQHAALCRRPGAIPLVADHSRGVSFLAKYKQSREDRP